MSINAINMNYHYARERLDNFINKLVSKNVAGEIFIVGSTAIMFNLPEYQRVTTDIDVSISLNKNFFQTFKETAQEVADELEMSHDWINASVFYVMPDKKDKGPHEYFNNGTLKVRFASKEYLLAMKVMTSRKKDRDIEDGAILFNKLNLKDADEVIDIVEQYYTRPPRSELMNAFTIAKRAKQMKKLN